ncbi:hypothetical protein HGA91_06250 [candidate division WWE3 bacterium]|nr:hypothetical protein [candidate division WWE3 bacterium]
MYKSESGFVELVILVGAVVLIGVGAFFLNFLIVRETGTKNDPPKPMYSIANNNQDVPSGSCKPGDPGLFTSDVTDMSAVNLIQNPIRLVGGKNIKTHSYIEVKQKSPVYAPMDATLTGGSNYLETYGPNPVTKVQYILSFNDGCDVSFWLDHLVDVPEKIRLAFPAEPSNDTKSVAVQSIDIKAGELVGYSNQDGRARFDFGVVNLKAPQTSLTTNPQYKDDEIVKTSKKYRFAVCPFNLYNAEKLQEYQKYYDPTVTSDQEIIDDICD